MSVAAAQALVTWDAFVALPEDDRRELIDGRLVEVEVPTKWHEKIVALLAFHLTGWARSRGLHVLVSGYKVRIAEHRGVMPDVQVLTDETYRAADERALTEGRPEIAVEVISPSSRRYDRVRKLEWYASIGVPEYWIIDADARTVEQLVLTGDRYLIARTAEEDATFAPAGRDGLEVPLAELWDALHE